ncbi:hypothetical protein F4809DRAFT_656594 [Biscogniauxia mediterranea]|nr:hypothetical protein F4809DRAFT_656594 [Biscogniauxia mediterranea]
MANLRLSYHKTVVPGAFVHQWDVRLGDFITFLFALKIGILLEWQRVFVPPGSRGSIFWATQLMIFAVLGFYLAPLVALNDTRLTNKAASVFNFISDILILMIPQSAI